MLLFFFLLIDIFAYCLLSHGKLRATYDTQTLVIKKNPVAFFLLLELRL